MPPMQMGPMGPPHEESWEEIAKRLKIQIANAEKGLSLAKADLREAESHIKEK